MPKIMKIGLSLSKICRKYRRLFFPDTVYRSTVVAVLLRRCARRPASHGSIVDDEAASNWQCRVGLSTGADATAWSSSVGGQLAAVAETGPPDGVDPPDDGEGAAHEALLMTKKKDAEIAALLRHIRLSGGVVSRDGNPEARRRPPGFNECVIERINFERSLGYFP